mmetsp:Transcript_6867/g.23407  ORF Transcript_6867/g.23407 Transcript_6867/m.23407 type:complete len:266 (+) Transcript_6867:979-1776(+)
MLPPQPRLLPGPRAGPQAPAAVGGHDGEVPDDTRPDHLPRGRPRAVVDDPPPRLELCGGRAARQRTHASADADRIDKALGRGLGGVHRGDGHLHARGGRRAAPAAVGHLREEQDPLRRRVLWHEPARPVRPSTEPARKGGEPVGEQGRRAREEGARAGPLEVPDAHAVVRAHAGDPPQLPRGPEDTRGGTIREGCGPQCVHDALGAGHGLQARAHEGVVGAVAPEHAPRHVRLVRPGRGPVPVQECVVERERLAVVHGVKGAEVG